MFDLESRTLDILIADEACFADLWTSTPFRSKSKIHIVEEPREQVLPTGTLHHTGFSL